MDEILPVTCEGYGTWVEENLERARRERESVALWVWNDDFYESQLLWTPAATEEFLRNNPWARQFFT